MTMLLLVSWKGLHILEQKVDATKSRAHHCYLQILEDDIQLDMVYTLYAIFHIDLLAIEFFHGKYTS
jgi:hypothetical protein